MKEVDITQIVVSALNVVGIGLSAFFARRSAVHAEGSKKSAKQSARIIASLRPFEEVTPVERE